MENLRFLTQICHYILAQKQALYSKIRIASLQKHPPGLQEKPICIKFA